MGLGAGVGLTQCCALGDPRPAERCLATPHRAAPVGSPHPSPVTLSRVVTACQAPDQELNVHRLLLFLHPSHRVNGAVVSVLQKKWRHKVESAGVKTRTQISVNCLLVLITLIS